MNGLLRNLQRWLTCGRVTKWKKSTRDVGVPSFRLGAQMEEIGKTGGQCIQTSSMNPKQGWLPLLPMDTQCQLSTIATSGHGHSVPAVCHSCIAHGHLVPASSGLQCHLKLIKLSESFVDFRIILRVLRFPTSWPEKKLDFLDF